MTAVLVERPGLLTTIQDEGRWGFQASGVPVSGAMDWWSHRAANSLVGNDPTAAALEVTVAGPTIVASTPVTLAVTGASFDLRVGSRSIRSPHVLRLDAGERLEFGARLGGCRAYVAFGGGIDVAPVLGSRSTDLRSGLGGLGGRAVRAGDVLPIGASDMLHAGHLEGSSLTAPLLSAPAVLRFLPYDDFDSDDVRTFCDAVFSVSPRSDRVGYRLEGPIAVERRSLRRLSKPAVMGVIQLPPGGGPVLLMADAQPTGGYPIVGCVITGDLPIAGQLAPGDAVRFRICTEEEAAAVLADRERTLPQTERMRRADR